MFHWISKGLCNSSLIEEIFNIKNWKKTCSTSVFFAIVWTPDLGKKNFTTWIGLKSEVYLTYINFWKFLDDLKISLEIIRLRSWPGNVKFSVTMQFFTFLTPWKICFRINDKFKINFFLKVNLEVFTFPQNQDFYLRFQTFNREKKLLKNIWQSHILSSNSAEKIIKMAIRSEPLGLCGWKIWNFLFSIRLSNGEYLKDF